MENNNITPPENNFSDSFEQSNQKTGKKEKIITAVLVVIFLGVLLGALWDLYGKNLLYKNDVKNVSLNNNLQATNTNQAMITPEDQGPKNNQQAKPTNPAPKTDSSVEYSSYSTCLENTKDGPAAKDCCDCLSGDASIHKACRDATVTYDFSKNTVFKTFEIPSKLGKTGDYSAFTASGNQAQCKQACESASSGLMCGDYQYCRTACNNLPQ